MNKHSILTFKIHLMKTSIIFTFLCAIVLTMVSCDRGPTSGNAPSEYCISIWGESDDGKLISSDTQLEIKFSDQIGEDGVDGYVTQSIEIPKSIYPTVWHSRYNDIGMYLSFTNTTQDTLYVVFTKSIDISQGLDNVFNSTNNNNTSIEDVFKEQPGGYVELVKKVLPGKEVELEY